MATVNAPLIITVPAESIDDEAFDYRWELVEVPTTSRAQPPTPIGGDAVFTADVGGDYIIDRWIVHGLVAYQAHRYMVGASRPIPIVIASAQPDRINAGERVDLDGSQSYSPDGSQLSYRWFDINGCAPSIFDSLSARAWMRPTRTGYCVVNLEVSNGEKLSSTTATVYVLP